MRPDPHGLTWCLAKKVPVVNRVERFLLDNMIGRRSAMHPWATLFGAGRLLYGEPVRASMGVKCFWFPSTPRTEPRRAEGPSGRQRLAAALCSRLGRIVRP
jgi:hypothetical protein